MIDPRYPLNDPGALPSPSLLVFRDLVVRNLRTMIEIARRPDRLRPHVKTHKMPGVIRLAQSLGINKHKVATIAEAEMVARAGGADVLLAYPLVGPNIARFLRLREAYPATTFRAVVDDEAGARSLSDAVGSGPAVSTLVDLDVGMGRTGIDPARAFALYEQVASFPGLTPDGLHAYDGHVRDKDLEARHAAAKPGYEQALALRERLEARGLPVPRIVLGGTPTFPIHAAVDVPGSECSPGTCVFHDGSYSAKFPELPFTPAALILTRVISRPRPGRITLDLGYKAVAADPAGDRVTLLGVADATLGGQSEEHLVVDTPRADDYPPGTPLLAIPTHVCPTSALYRSAYVIEGGEVIDEWPVEARDRAITV